MLFWLKISKMPFSKNFKKDVLTALLFTLLFLLLIPVWILNLNQSLNVFTNQSVMTSLADKKQLKMVENVL